MFHHNDHICASHRLHDMGSATATIFVHRIVPLDVILRSVSRLNSSSRRARSGFCQHELGWSISNLCGSSLGDFPLVQLWNPLVALRGPGGGVMRIRGDILLMLVGPRWTLLCFTFYTERKLQHLIIRSLGPVDGRSHCTPSCRPRLFTGLFGSGFPVHESPRSEQGVSRERPVQNRNIAHYRLGSGCCPAFYQGQRQGKSEFRSR